VVNCGLVGITTLRIRCAH